MKALFIGTSGLAIVALLALDAYRDYRRFHRPLLTTPYQAVTVVGGETLYGRIDHLGSDHPVLREAHSLKREADPKGGGDRFVLVRRSAGPAGSDHVILPATSILYVEPIAPDSIVGRLIAQQQPR